MRLTTAFLNTDSKRWLAVLAVACLASMAALAHSFMNTASSVEENNAAVQQSATVVADEAQTRSEPAWNSAPQVAAAENHETDVRVSPFEGKGRLLTKTDELAERQKKVHFQAEYLRTLIAEGKVPAGLGHLTKEQVDEMERNGEMIQ
jgi:hypothetical protein